MLSVLIPIFNFDVRAFVKQLSEQGSQLDGQVEIICLDDCSQEQIHKINSTIGELPGVRYERSEVNLGRSAVRNRLEEMAKHENLLFLDCDGKVVRDDYLSKYCEIEGYGVVYGGRSYQEKKPDDPGLNFHWYCGSLREEIIVEDRLKNPYKSFMTNNFLIRREVYKAIRMDESVKGYGHEDTLFAMELKRAGFKVGHIDNPLEHIGIEHVDVFLHKSANGVRNLARLIEADKVDDSIKLVRYYHRFTRLGLIGPISWLVRKNENRILNSLRGPAPNLLWFDLWKLALLAKELGAISKD